jgi:Fuc2NAc and GlcNAc transferase
MIFLPLFLLFIFSCLSTIYLRKYLISKNIIDIPNERSSHSVPTPRGGGVTIVISFLLGVIVYAISGAITWKLANTLIVAGAVVAVIGFLDDHQHIKSGIRLIFHLIGSAIIIYSFGGIPVLHVFSFIIDFGFLSNIIAVLISIWSLNLFNFMDGIDGIAGVEVLSVSIIMGGICFLVFDAYEVALLFFILSTSTLGFLFQNFPPAKIFMGDAGSGFLGLIIFALILLSAQISENLFWSGLVLYGVFLVDSTLCLLIRISSGHKPHEAHCCHAYQNAARKYGSHKLITLSVFFINVFWLGPLAILISLNKLAGFQGMLLAYIPLIIIALKFNVGNENS